MAVADVCGLSLSAELVSEMPPVSGVFCVDIESDCAECFSRGSGCCSCCPVLLELEMWS